MSGDLIESFSGIRGIYGQGITEDLAYKYGVCYCRLFSKKGGVLVMAGDSRPSTPSLKKAIFKAFKDCGVKKVIDIGIVPIQVCEYAIFKFKTDGGVYVSASHNEPEYNGWKFLKKDGALLYTSQSDKLIQTVHQNNELSSGAKTKNAKTLVVGRNGQAINQYVSYLLGRLGKKELQELKKTGIKVLLDPNGGAVIPVLKKLLGKLPIKTSIVNGQLGRFNRLVEPNVKSLSYLKEKVAQGSFAFAAGFDADGDRVEFIINPSSSFAKEMGAEVSGQYILALACDSILQDTKNQVVVTNDATSYLVRDVIKKHNAVMKEAEVGEMQVVEEMEKNKSIIGGEGSCGGVIIPPIKCRDGIITIALILKLMALRKKLLPEILDSYPHYYEAITNVSCPPEKSLIIKDRAENYFRSLGYKIKKTGDKNGGLKALPNPDNFVWFRQSRTEPGVFRIFSEGNDKKKVAELLTEGVRIFNQENEHTDEAMGLKEERKKIKGKQKQIEDELKGAEG